MYKLTINNDPFSVKYNLYVQVRGSFFTKSWDWITASDDINYIKNYLRTVSNPVIVAEGTAQELLNNEDLWK